MLSKAFNSEVVKPCFLQGKPCWRASELDVNKQGRREVEGEDTAVVRSLQDLSRERRGGSSPGRQAQRTQDPQVGGCRMDKIDCHRL